MREMRTSGSEGGGSKPIAPYPYHVFLAGQRWMAGTSPAMTPEEWFNMNAL